MPVLYAVIDMTTVETSKIITVCEFQASVYWGRIYKDQGKTVAAPALNAQAFTKLEHLALQYLFWNTFGKTPNDDYATLVQDCVREAATLPVDKTDLRVLERDANRATAHLQSQYTLDTEDPNQLPGAAKPAEPSRPRSAGATKQVWDIADEMYAAASNSFPDRQDFIAACVAKGINAATASTQFSKWKKSKA